MPFLQPTKSLLCLFHFQRKVDSASGTSLSSARLLKLLFSSFLGADDTSTEPSVLTLQVIFSHLLLLNKKKYCSVYSNMLQYVHTQLQVTHELLQNVLFLWSALLLLQILHQSGRKKGCIVLIHWSLRIFFLNGVKMFVPRFLWTNYSIPCTPARSQY